MILSSVGIAVFAISGALLGLRKQMDIVGIWFVAIVTGIGGGTLRDLLLGQTPVGWVTNPRDIVICLVCGLAVSFLNRPLSGRRLQWLLYADAAGLSLFTVLGASTALTAGAHPLIAIMFGAMSASFGGVIRDVMCNDTPILFQKDLYITPALLGAGAFVVADGLLGFEERALIGVIIALTVRILAIQRGWYMPFPRYK
ncbi:trimeric intracellular cation channel family protein [Parvularcula sp. LCG005]|uniref:trimeric intracellular cation channel family protein n=1 Tax=Parvularcula sp. LCG005 TaxID=3078805 RepID=UPI002942ADB6|nr:trimeric intracellular cation channel family protein [Parvularcula sp. LCG005]WOI54681.1 trimeric intracellular cation channel family protein [Parvularcula sp. LCG005]